MVTTERASMPMSGHLITRDYGKSRPVLDVPHLIDMPKRSYERFLDRSLRELFDEISPIEDFTGTRMALSFIDYYIESPKLDERECRQRDATYGAPLKVIAELTVKETGEVKEQELYLGDLNEGIAGTGIRAGAIKIATEECTPENEFQLRVAAMAHRATGTPLMTHSNPTIGSGADQQRVFAEEGVDLERVVIGHSGDTTDVDYLSGLMDRGSTIGMDRFGAPIGASTAERIGTIAELCRRGYAGRVVLSHDTSCHFNSVLPEVLAQRMPEWHFLLIPDHVLPELERLGVTEEQVRAMMVDNPRRLFEAQEPY